MTGLPNRAGLLARLTAALRRERAAGRPTVVLLFCDLDGFKAVNDRLGHAAGDRLLAEVAGRIGTGLRPGDMVARYGGDEFLVLAEEVDQGQAVVRLSAHIENALCVPFRIDTTIVQITCSVGTAISDGAAVATDLIVHADQAMYRAKERRRAVVA